MECIPAIDLRGGEAVRLVQGDFANETGYGDPVALAERYAEAGARLVHVVDLDAARGAPESNRAVVEAIVSSVGIAVELGGGIRSEEIAEHYLEIGVERLVVGTAGVEDPALLARLCAAHPERILLGLDHRRVGDGAGLRREVALRGWLEGSGRDLDDVVASVRDVGLAGLVVTDISRDGTLAGPDLDGYRDLLAATEVPIVASGGVGTLADLEALDALESNGRRLEGVIVGKAILSGAFSIEEALSLCAR
jgi:phosphoribosylformimino-5-aminoimidazole carboxamide ribotide isomerase